MNQGDTITGHFTYVVGDKIGEGELCDLYRAHRPLGDDVVLKIARGDDDPVSNEGLTLAKLRTGPGQLQPYLANLIDSFYHDGVWVNAFEPLDGWFTLEQVHDVYPELDPRDMAWMFRRLLVVLGHIHRLEVVHAAIVPTHVLIHPDMHGLTLVDWCYARPLGDPLDERSDQYATWYPPNAGATRELDLGMAARLIVWLLGGDPINETLPDSVPREMRVFLNAMLKPMPVESDAWVIKNLFDELIERLWGPRRFRPFTMGVNGRS